MTMALPNFLRFWGYLIPVIPSILCSLFVLYQLLMQRALRIAIHNHVIILMLLFGLLYEVTDIVWYLHFYRTGKPLFATPIFCRIWVFIDGAVYVIIGILMAWASIERHILIFHQHWNLTKIKCFFIHYLPLIVCSAYPTMFYGAFFFFVPCDIPFDYDQATCNYYSCISWNPFLSFWDSVVNYVLPSFIIVVFSIALLVRTLYRRHRVRGRIEWRNYWRMAVQVLSISAIYFIFLLPPMSLNTAYTLWLPWDGGSDYYWTTMYLGYYTVLLTPFVCIFSVPELRSKCKQLFSRRQERAIAPFSTKSVQRNMATAAFQTAIKQ